MTTLFYYGFYLHFCYLVGNCVPISKYDSNLTYERTQALIEIMGEHEHWENVNGNLISIYAYGDCAIGRYATEADIDSLVGD